MADVRALLRQQRAARGLDQPSSRHGETQLRKQKRKHTDDTDMVVDDLGDDGTYRNSKRSRPADDVPAIEREASEKKTTEKKDGKEDEKDGGDDGDNTPTKTTLRRPPSLQGRTNGTPAHGIEIKIPSRPATPNTPRGDATGSSLSSGGLSSASTPKTVPLGRSPLVPQEGTMAAPAAAAKSATAAATTVATETTETAKAEIDEDEWAAFEAQVVNAPPAKDAKTAINGAGVISAAPVSADEAASSREEQNAQRRAKEASAIDDEKEEAKRALETEFEEMEELEARVKKLKEKREALRKVSSVHEPAGAVGEKSSAEKENMPQGTGSKADGEADEEDDDDDDESDDDDWDGFRFRA